MIQIELFGKPVPWSSPRLGRGVAYSPHAHDKEKAQWQVKSQYRDAPIQGAVHLDFTFFFPIPQGTSSIRRKQMLAHIILPTVRPDSTNVQKFYEDCLTGIVIEDDKFATDHSSRKRYSEKPGVLIRIFPLSLYSNVAPEAMMRPRPTLFPAPGALS